jgi:hypothetical protein
MGAQALHEKSIERRAAWPSPRGGTAKSQLGDLIDGVYDVTSLHFDQDQHRKST